MKTMRFPFWISSRGARTLPQALARTFATLAALALLFPGAAAAAPELFCQPDDLTGLSVPSSRSQGVCVQDTATSRVLTLYTENGLLIAQTDALGLGGAGSSSLLQLTGAPVELLYCAAAHLNPETGAPASQCIASDGTPGPSALSGSGTIQANAAVGLLGSLQCPSSVHVRGVVHSPAGEAFQVQGSLLRFWDSDDAAACETVTEELSTEYLGPATAPLQQTFSRLGLADASGLDDSLLPDPNPEQMRLLEVVANLDDNQFEFFKSLTGLTPDAWEDLASHLDTTEAAQRDSRARGYTQSGRPPSKKESHIDADEPHPPDPPRPPGNSDNENRQPSHDDIQTSLAAITVIQTVINGKLDLLMPPPPPLFEKTICVQLAAFRAGGSETEVDGELRLEGLLGAVVYGNGAGFAGGLKPDVAWTSETKGELGISFEVCVDPQAIRDRLAAREAAIPLSDAALATPAMVDDSVLLDRIATLIEHLNVSEGKLADALDLVPTLTVGRPDVSNILSSIKADNNLSKLAGVLPLPSELRDILQDPAALADLDFTPATIRDLLCPADSPFPPAVAARFQEICNKASQESLGTAIATIHDKVGTIETLVAELAGKVPDAPGGNPVCTETCETARAACLDTASKTCEKNNCKNLYNECRCQCPDFGYCAITPLIPWCD